MEKTSQQMFPLISQCPICSGYRLHYLFSVKGYRTVRCDDCGLLMLNPQPSDEEFSEIQRMNFSALESSETGRVNRGDPAAVEQAMADTCLDLLMKYGCGSGRLLQVGCKNPYFLERAAAKGFNATGLVDPRDPDPEIAFLPPSHGAIHFIQGEIEASKGSDYDICVILDIMNTVRNPQLFLQQIHRLLKPGGVILLSLSSSDSWSARRLREKWPEFKPDRFFYFNEATLQSLLFHGGFGEMVLKPSTKTFLADYKVRHLKGDLIEEGKAPMASRMVLIARAQEKRKRKLSLVVPAFNEVATIENALTKLLEKEIKDLDIEIILVESNSTDGTREIVLKYKDHPRIKLILEDRPRGKGHAVRTGLEQITGDFVLIQDADLEYDLEDYDVLLEPLVAGREAFVLGSRHGGRSFKMRHFNDQPVQGLVLNLGHWFFTFLINILFGLNLKDPFTMYKVFRRDCLYGLTFECDRFDFDFELLIKLVRKGYSPIEIPVNYRSRSFKQGKKVSIWRDPLTWIRALVKYRLVKIDPLLEIERQWRESAIRIENVGQVTQPKEQY